VISCEYKSEGAMSDVVIAETEYGKVKGVRKISALNCTYNAFLGIRYATPPIGELRFKVS
jgi:cholinesterase